MTIPHDIPLLAADVGPLRPVRVAVVGLGKMGIAHTALLSMIPGAELVGVVDRRPALARRLRGIGFRAPAYASMEDLLERERPEAVWVCTPPDSHWPVARPCIEAGAAVFVEKPLAHTLDDATAIARLAATRGVRVACGYTLAFWPTFAAGHDALTGGAVGRVRRAAVSMYLSQVFEPKKGWMYEPERSGGGVVANVSSHALFVLRWYLGMPVAARATWTRRYGDVEDELTGVFVLADGTEVTFHSSWSAPDHPIAWAAVDVEGEDGMLSVTNDTLTLTAAGAAGGWPAGRTTLEESQLPQPARFHLNGEAYYCEDAHFLAWVTGGPPPPVAVSAGLEVQRLMAALYASARAGGAPVAVAE